MANIVIVGTGMAGYTLAREIRKRDKAVNLHLLSRDDGAFYSKPMLSNALAKDKTPATLVTSSAEQMEEQLNAKIETHCEVELIDAENRQIRFGTQSLPYDQLILAVGATQLDPGLKGQVEHPIYSVNNLADYDRFHQALKSSNRVAIIGTGLIGCEFANDIVEVDKQAIVIGPGMWPLGRLLPEQVGLHVKSQLEKSGIQWQLESKAVAISKQGDACALTLDSGTTVEADIVLSSIGLIPDVRLAKSASLACNRGIVVDEYLRTSNDNIFAIGDCAEINSLVLPFILPIMHSARSLAVTLTTKPTSVSFPAMPVVVKTPAHGMVVSPPNSNAKGEWQCSQSDDAMKALFYSENNDLLGYVLTGAAMSEKQQLTKLLPPVLSN